MLSMNLRDEGVDLLLNLGSNNHPSTSQMSARNVATGSNGKRSASSHNDVVDLSSDDEEKATTPVSKIFRSPTVTLTFPDGVTVKREAVIVMDLLQRRYIDSFVIDPLMRHLFIHGSRFDLGYVNSQNFSVWQNLVKKYSLDRVRTANEARELLTKHPGAMDDLRRNIEMKNFVTDTSKEYTAIVVFLPNGKHWYLIIVSHLAQWLHAPVYERFSIKPPFVHVFDSLLQDIDRKGGHNYRILPKVHNAELENTLFPIMRFAAMVFKNDPGLFITPIRWRDVREVFGQATSFDCGAFVLLFTEKIANGKLLETTNIGGDFGYWGWSKDNEQMIWDDKKMVLEDMSSYRAICYRYIKEMVTNGKELLTEAEWRLASGLSAFEGEPFEETEGKVNRESLASIGFKTKEFEIIDGEHIGDHGDDTSLQM